MWKTFSGQNQLTSSITSGKLDEKSVMTGGFSGTEEVV